MSNESVREYFDAEAEPYADAYASAATDDPRVRTFLERRELSLNALRGPVARVLYIGAGPGVFTNSLAVLGASCWVVDLSLAMVNAARRRLSPGPSHRARFTAPDVDHLPFA